MAFKSVHESPRKKRSVIVETITLNMTIKYVWLDLWSIWDDNTLSAKRETYDVPH